MAKLFIKNGNNYREYYVHQGHEIDMMDFLKNHPNKQGMSSYTRLHEGVEWFTFLLTTEDIKTIKKTSWYRNTSWDEPTLDDELIEGAIIEAIIVEPPQ